MRAKKLRTSRGEAVPATTSIFHDALTTPGLVAVEASAERGRLLLADGNDFAALAIDASNSIKASNSLEKMLAHQLAVAHMAAMEQIKYPGTAVAQVTPTTTLEKIVARSGD